MAGEDDGEGKRALQALHGHCNSLLRCPLMQEIMREQVSNDFGIGLGHEAMTTSRQLAAQLIEIFDDPVVDNGDLIGGVRMSVDLARTAMRGPARVADTDAARNWLAPERRFEIV